MVFDAFSRKALGWALDRNFAIRLMIEALQPAIERRLLESGSVHHSDRALQFASVDYAALGTWIDAYSATLVIYND
jgi:putative transposase